jgi:membrane-associated phospholipid phosphatase
MSPITRNWLVAFVVTVAATPLCMVYADRPAAEFFYRHVREAPSGHAVREIFAPAPAIVLVALLVLAASAIGRAVRGDVPGWAKTPLLYSWAILLGVATERILKHLFGRLSPQTFVVDHSAGFLWFQGNESTAFPSGTAIVSLTIATLLWLTSRWRTIAIALAGLPCLAVIINADHWISDVIAGAFVGTFLGWATLHLVGDRPPVLPRR